jgi:carbonic anhydrase
VRISARAEYAVRAVVELEGVYVITCIDPRADPADFLGIHFSDAIVARTVGGRVTPAVIQDVAYIGY